jgi:hypothetical protein
LPYIVRSTLRESAMARAAFLASLALVCALSSSMAAEPPAPATEASPPATQPSESSAQQPAASEKPTEASAQQPQASSQSAAPKNTKVVLTDDTITEAQLHLILARGYKPEGRPHEVRYCRREQIMNSRFEQKACRTAQQILDEQRNGQEMVERAQRTHPSITGN